MRAERWSAWFSKTEVSPGLARGTLCLLPRPADNRDGGASTVDKVERILEVPACYVSRETANLLAERVRAVADEQVNADYEQALREMAPRLNITPEEAINRYMGNAVLRRLLVARKDRTIFISPHGNVQYGGRDVLYEEIPMDPSQVIIDVPGINGKYLNVSLTTDLMQIFPLHQANKILVQGNDRAWVYGLYQELHTAVAASKKVLRDFVYRWLRPLAFVGFIALSFLELRLFQLLRPGFTIHTPLTGLSVLIAFILLLANQYLVLSVGGRSMRYLYPYFELEDRLSERRKDLRRWWVATVTTVYGGGLWAVVTMLWG